MTTVFEMVAKRNHESVVFCSDDKLDLRGIIAIHDTTLGPALGGARMKSYTCEDEALMDVLRLSRAMTYKASAAGLNLGGGKSVLILRPGQEKTPELLKAFADRIQMLGGTYIAAGDVGSNTHDLKVMRSRTKWVAGLAEADGGLGDSAILTSLGVFMGLKAAVKHKLGTENLSGVKVAVQGTGKVGHLLVGHLLEHGCEVVVADSNVESVIELTREFPQVKSVAADEIYYQDVDVFSPNAIGGLLTEAVANKMTAKIVAGGANNPLDGEHTAKILHQRDILYAPDFVVNAGGIIMISCELEHLTFARAKTMTEGIYDKTLSVFHFAEDNDLLPWDAAKTMAVDRIHKYRATLDKDHPVAARPIVNEA